MFTPEKPAHHFAPSETVPPPRAQLLSHDVRSALSGVLGGLALMDTSVLSKENKSHFDRAHVSAKMLLKLVDGAADILGYQSAAVEEKEFSLQGALENLRQRWADEARQKHITIDFVVPEMPVNLAISALNFERIFNNLLGNALKFTNSGTVFVEFSCSDGCLIGKVIDSGPGFSERALETLFLYKGRPEGAEKQGTGLGLYIAKTLVEEAQGTITARNSTGVGAVLTVSLPCTCAEIPAAKKAKSKDLPDLSHLKILMAEDNLTNQMVAKQMLLTMNATCSLASDGVEAVEMFEAEEFDLCLIDIEMPRMSGLEVMRNIRGRSDARAATPLIALTAYVLPEHQERISAAGASGLIAKPLTNITEFGNNILSFASPAASKPEQPEQPKPIGQCIDFQIYDGLAEMIGAESMLELLGKVKVDIETVKAGVAEGLKSRDGGIIGSNTHILISVAGAIGAVDLQHLAQSLNTLSKTSNWGDIAQGVSECVSGCTDVLAFVESRL